MSAGRGLTLASGWGGRCSLLPPPEVAVEAGCRREKSLARGKVQLLRLLSLGLVIVPELLDPGSERENRSSGREAQISLWQPPAPLAA